MNETTAENLLRQERDDAILAHHLALAHIEALESAIRIVRDEIGDRTHGAMYGECCRWWSVLETALAEEKKP